MAYLLLNYGSNGDQPIYKYLYTGEFVDKQMSPIFMYQRVYKTVPDKKNISATDVYVLINFLTYYPCGHKLYHSNKWP